ARRRLSLTLLKQAMASTARLTAFVVFILVGARVFSLTFYGVDGHKWVEELLLDLPGGQLGFLIVVNVLVFVLAFFLDFFELSFIVVPLLGPVAEKLGIDLIWFGVLLGVNMQTSFMHPPFGFALFFLRSVAPPSVKTMEIYWGAVPFVVIQMIMVGLVIAFPGMVTGGLEKDQKVDLDKVEIIIPTQEEDTPTPVPGADQSQNGQGAAPEEDDPSKAIERALKESGGK
ncbi:MAG: TRAP transporter large permease subunit, partial [Rhodocyclaceae bacterium]|nr:TRAP transporter large permease subunit [Rhodocyclaceae bacterium]